jgi:hypothetical protein
MWYMRLGWTSGSYSFGASIQMSGSVMHFGRSQLRSEAYLHPLRTRPALGCSSSHSISLPKPCLTSPTSEHRHPFCEPEHPSVPGHVTPRYVHAFAWHDNCSQCIAFPYWDGQHVRPSLYCFQSPAGRLTDILDTTHFSGVSANLKFKSSTTAHTQQTILGCIARGGQWCIAKTRHALLPPQHHFSACLRSHKIAS